jgi:hypothetical protein
LLVHGDAVLALVEKVQVLVGCQQVRFHAPQQQFSRGGSALGRRWRIEGHLPLWQSSGLVTGGANREKECHQQQRRSKQRAAHGGDGSLASSFYKGFSLVRYPDTDPG